MAEITYLEAIREALVEEMERDERVFLLGEDIGAYGGAFKVTAGLQERFGEDAETEESSEDGDTLYAARKMRNNKKAGHPRGEDPENSDREGGSDGEKKNRRNIRDSQRKT